MNDNHKNEFIYNKKKDKNQWCFWYKFSVVYIIKFWHINNNVIM